MNVYKTDCLLDLLKENTYPGRGIAIGKTADGENAVAVYFIMGRSENSRNRIFKVNGEDITIYPFDESKVSDPSLIIYSPVRKFENKLIVTNGDQTDTVYDHLADGESFEAALDTREFEPDAPNFTPRISGMLTFENNDFTYKMNILKSADAEGTACSRYTFTYPAIAGVGHFIHTYNCDGNPLPTFTGEPERISLPNDIDDLTKKVWEALDDNNKISMFVRFTNLKTGKTDTRIVNKHEGGLK
ncbi:MAG: IMP cyclohydrolase [Clostridia bacterium]|nr:IMP cyclohydrolase [Clostridia bacterium]